MAATRAGRGQDYQGPRVCLAAHAQPALVTPQAHFGLLLRSAVPAAVLKKHPFLVKEDAMKAAAGVFFRTYLGPSDACKKLLLGDPKKGTPHIIYYLNKIKESADRPIHCALATPLKEKQTDAGEAVRSPDPTGANVPVSGVVLDTVATCRAATLPPAPSPSVRPTGKARVDHL